MSNLADLQFSMTGEANAVKTRTGKSTPGVINYNVKKLPKWSKESWVVFKLVGGNHKGAVYLDNVDDVIHPESGRIERMRLLRGVPSIWLKDQKEVTKEYADKNAVTLKFDRGHRVLRVKGIDENVIEFLFRTNCNVGNQDRAKGTKVEIYCYDSAAAEKEAFAKEEFELEMAILAKETEAVYMKKHAAFLGIRLVNDIGEQVSDDGLRRDYVMYAKRNPDYFKRTHKTDEVELSWLVRKGIAESLIDVSSEPGRISWAKNGGVICVIPQSRNPHEYLTELAMTNTKEGQEFKAQLKKIVT
jgi:hypothetical protein